MIPEEQMARSTRQFEVQLHALRDTLKRRIMLAFANVASEGDAIAEEVFQQLGEGAGPDYDSSQDVVIAQEAWRGESIHH